jgi:hypothetical protein
VNISFKMARTVVALSGVHRLEGRSGVANDSREGKATWEVG